MWKVTLDNSTKVFWFKTIEDALHCTNDIFNIKISYRFISK
jgi:hypothetical protein